MSNEPQTDTYTEALSEKRKALHGEVLDDDSLLSDAVHGENREHQMGMLEAVRLYPMACLWAFVFAFTIVSSGSRLGCVQN